MASNSSNPNTLNETLFGFVFYMNRQHYIEQHSNILSKMQAEGWLDFDDVSRHRDQYWINNRWWYTSWDSVEEWFNNKDLTVTEEPTEAPTTTPARPTVPVTVVTIPASLPSTTPSPTTEATTQGSSSLIAPFAIIFLCVLRNLFI